MNFFIKEDIEWAEELLIKINEKEKKVVALNENKIPYSTKKGRFDDYSNDENICWWTNGFYAGMLWQLYNAFCEDRYRETAIAIEEKLDKNFLNAGGMDHDNGFKWLLTAVANYKNSGCPMCKNRGKLAADNLAGRFNPVAGMIRAWNDHNEPGDTAGLAIIDCLMNLPLLYWAYDTFKDPRYKHIAVSHATRAIDLFVREDGSVNHIVTFDPETGEFIKALGGQGMCDGSSWTRGQGWAIYGFTLSYIHTKDEKYLETATRVADYILKNIPENGVIPVDFLQPRGIKYEDSTAAAIMACGFIELSKVLNDNDGKRYYDAAILLLKTLANRSLCLDDSTDNLINNCSAAYNDKKHNFSIIYGDYYFVEALLKLTGKELFMW